MSENDLLPVRDRAAEWGLSDREVDVLLSLAKGKGNRAIAAELYIGAETVKSHLKSIYRKLGVSSRAEATARVLNEGRFDHLARVDASPPIAIRSATTGGVTRVIAIGELDLATAPALATELADALDATDDVEVDLEGVTFIDSSGLRALVDAMRSTTDGKRFAVVRASSAVVRVLELTGLTDHLGLSPTSA